MIDTALEAQTVPPSSPHSGSRLAEAPRPPSDRKQIYPNVEAPSGLELEALAAKGLRLDELAFISGALTENFHIFAVQRIGANPTSATDDAAMPVAPRPNG